MNFRAPAFFSPAFSRRSAASTLAVFAAGLLAACFQDPAQTGSNYLGEHGVRLNAPLYHVVLDDLPVDSSFATELPLDHFGESLMVIGRESRYMASVRLGFQLSGGAQHRGIDTGVFLRLVPRPARGIAGGAFLHNSRGARIP